LSQNTIKSLSPRKLLNNSLSPRRERVRVRGLFSFVIARVFGLPPIIRTPS